MPTASPAAPAPAAAAAPDAVAKKKRPRYDVYEERIAVLLRPGGDGGAADVREALKAEDLDLEKVLVKIASDVEAPTWREAVRKVASELPDDRAYGRFSAPRAGTMPDPKKRNKVVSDEFE